MKSVKAIGLAGHLGDYITDLRQAEIESSKDVRWMHCIYNASERRGNIHARRHGRAVCARRCCAGCSTRCEDHLYHHCHSRSRDAPGKHDYDHCAEGHRCVGESGEDPGIPARAKSHR
ncbi:hypothetical protein VFPFJ_01913 [Purpureocillium lilacinum]|uniref:Uncharacterized protein n=1 Tax=Purpureocillium lilacinum TaxID=33203 RepID=A0A179HSA7_PURLI|nr:hypothetical protein VFPFJ_01913 [Purpureocillium lilacinum]OAQ92752.1 hypothetical protein VFPFJ_01913 [Purpureocillium lilacinum]